MRTDAEKIEEIKGLSMAMADAVKARGAFQPADMIEAALAMIVVMSEKIGADPRATMAHLLLAVCGDDVRKAIRSVKLSAYARAVNESETLDVFRSASDAPAPTVEQIKTRLRAALPDYRALGFEPNAKNVITDISAEVAKMIEEARR